MRSRLKLKSFLGFGVFINMYSAFLTESWDATTSIIYVMIIPVLGFSTRRPGEQ